MSKLRCLLIIFHQDYVLWNRLGSSLSNGSKPEEALGAYREALQLRPSYTRAIYNVGVACTYTKVPFRARTSTYEKLFSLRFEHGCTQGRGGTLLECVGNARVDWRGVESTTMAHPPACISIDGGRHRVATLATWKADKLSVWKYVGPSRSGGLD